MEKRRRKGKGERSPRRMGWKSRLKKKVGSYGKGREGTPKKI